MAFGEVCTAPRRPVRTLPSSFWLGLTGVAAVLVAFEVVARLGVLPARSFPPVTVVLATLIQLVQTGDFWADFGRTLQGWAVGLGLAAALAVPIGMLVGSVEPVYRALRAIIEFLRPIPSVALIPATIMLFGIGTGMKVFLVAFASFWPILFQSIYGVQDVDPGIKETARVYGLGPLARFVWVIIPSTAAYVATGLRISSAIALILALTAEIVVGVAGLGRAIMIAHTAAAVPRMYALIAVTGILGWLLNGGFQRMERWFLRWHPSQREEVAA